MCLEQLVFFFLWQNKAKQERNAQKEESNPQYYSLFTLKIKKWGTLWHDWLCVLVTWIEWCVLIDSQNISILFSFYSGFIANICNENIFCFLWWRSFRSSAINQTITAPGKAEPVQSLVTWLIPKGSSADQDSTLSKTFPSRRKPMRAQNCHVQSAFGIMRKREWPSRDWFWCRIWLVERLAQVFQANTARGKAEPMQSLITFWASIKSGSRWQVSNLLQSPLLYFPGSYC